MPGIVHFISKCSPWLTDCGTNLRDDDPLTEVHEHSSLDTFFDQEIANTPTCLVIDLGELGFEAEQTCELLRERQRAGVALVLVDERPEAARVVQALQRGVVGYLDKDAAPQQLTQTIDGALAWSRQVRFLSAEIAALEVRFGRLTEREIEVLDLMALGKMSKEIARELFINKRTVDYHRERILRRIEARSAVEVLTLRARRERFEQQHCLLLRGALNCDDPEVHGSTTTCRIGADDRVVEMDRSWPELMRKRGYFSATKDVLNERIWNGLLPTPAAELYPRIFEHVRRERQHADFEVHHLGAGGIAHLRMRVRPLSNKGLEIGFLLLELEPGDGAQLTVLPKPETGSTPVCEHCSRFAFGKEWLMLAEARRRQLVSGGSARVTYELCEDCLGVLKGLLDRALVGRG